MKIQVILKTAEYRGDHSTDIELAYDVKENETVEDLVKRILTQNNGTKRKDGDGKYIIPIRTFKFNEHLELRVINEGKDYEDL